MDVKAFGLHHGGNQSLDEAGAGDAEEGDNLEVLLKQAHLLNRLRHLLNVVKESLVYKNVETLCQLEQTGQRDGSFEVALAQERESGDLAEVRGVVSFKLGVVQLLVGYKQLDQLH